MKLRPAGRLRQSLLRRVTRTSLIWGNYQGGEVVAAVAAVAVAVAAVVAAAVAVVVAATVANESHACA